MYFSGLQKLTLLDFPGRVACTVFTDGCNFRCPFCHNSSLVSGGALPVYSEEDILAFLQKRKGVLDGIAVTGGEPLLHADIIAFLRRVKALGYAVKLDTNGSRPELLKQIIEQGLTDYVAMDIKSSKERYPVVAGTDVDINAIEKSVDILMHGELPFEFRTTVVKELHRPEDFEDIGRWIAGDEHYYLQQFKDSGDILSEGMSACADDQMHRFLDIVIGYVPNTEIRGM